MHGVHLDSPGGRRCLGHGLLRERGEAAQREHHEGQSNDFHDSCLCSGKFKRRRPRIQDSSEAICSRMKVTTSAP